MRSSPALALLVVAFVGSSTHAQSHDHAAQSGAPVLGTVHFVNSGNVAAQASFQRGVAWLHNFKYQEAADAFQDAERRDSTLAIAYWLEALTHSHLLWNAEDLPGARAVLARLGPTAQIRLAKAKSPRERQFGAAVEAFFAEGSQATRTRGYVDSLRPLVESDSTDLEAAAFASHANMMAAYVLGPAAPEGTKYATASRALALRVYNANHDHPGAVHYLTHVADMDPRAAPDLLPFARAYDKIAPDADHALHMPSHVYLPLGLWPDVANANERAWAASRAEVKRDRSPPSALSWHSLEWLQAAYLQEGRWAGARALIDTASRLLQGVPISPEDGDARFAVNVLRFTYGMDTDDWSVWPSSGATTAQLFSYPTPTLRAWRMAMANAYQTAAAELFSTRNSSKAREVEARLRAKADTLRGAPRGRTVARHADQLAALQARVNGEPAKAVDI